MIARKLVRLPALNPGTIALQRRLIGYTSEQDMDGHGRILINRTLRDYAGIERQAMLVGQGNRWICGMKALGGADRRTERRRLRGIAGRAYVTGLVAPGTIDSHV